MKENLIMEWFYFKNNVKYLNMVLVLMSWKMKVKSGWKKLSIVKVEFRWILKIIFKIDMNFWINFRDFYFVGFIFFFFRYK